MRLGLSFQYGSTTPIRLVGLVLASVWIQYPPASQLAKAGPAASVRQSSARRSTASVPWDTHRPVVVRSRGRLGILRPEEVARWPSP